MLHGILRRQLELGHAISFSSDVIWRPHRWYIINHLLIITFLVQEGGNHYQFVDIDLVLKTTKWNIYKRLCFLCIKDVAWCVWSGTPKYLFSCVGLLVTVSRKNLVLMSGNQHFFSVSSIYRLVLCSTHPLLRMQTVLYIPNGRVQNVLPNFYGPFTWHCYLPLLMLFIYIHLYTYLSS